MSSAKDIRIEPVSSQDAMRIVRRFHYSGRVVQNSQLHLGVFIDGRCEGAMSFGPSLDKRKVQGLVAGTSWNSFLELNRMAFSDALPRNSESRALSIAFRVIRKQYPHIDWIVSFSDATMSGDGAIYRAAGFVLTGLKKNDQTWVSPTGEVRSRMTMTNITSSRKGGGASSMKRYIDEGWTVLPGFQLRYVKFLNPDARARLTVPVLPFSAIDEAGARMHRGVARPSVDSVGAGVEGSAGASEPATP
jgi:hypothetical protein